MSAMRGGSVAEKSAVCRSRRLAENRLEVLGEAHVEHLVGFVEDDDLHAVEAQRLAADVIERAARRGDDDVDAALERPKLRLHRRAAVDRQRDDAQRLAVLVHRLGHLHRQLARGHENQRAVRSRGSAFGSDEMQQRQRERGGLSRAGRRLAEQVAPREQRRNRLALDGRGLFVPERRGRGGGPVCRVRGGETPAGREFSVRGVMQEKKPPPPGGGGGPLPLPKFVFFGIKPNSGDTDGPHLPVRRQRHLEGTSQG